VDTLEIAANGMNTVSIALAARNSIHTWPAGIAGCGLFAVVFFKNQLYADALLQAFFITTSIAGWWQWCHHKAGAGLVEKPVTRESATSLGGMLVVGILVTTSYGFLLHRYTDAYQPYADSGVLVLSVIAQCLLMRRKVESWVFWLCANTVSVVLFASRGLELTAVLYSAYWFNAWYGWYRWRGVMTRMAVSEPPR
jgi:nicotinamide mononucleotide transporter